MRRAVWPFVVLAGACLDLPAVEPIAASPPDGGVEAGDDATTPASDGGNVDASADAIDERPPLPVPTVPCDASAQPVATGIFVSLTGSDTSAGTKAAPVRTLGKALALAKAQTAADIYVDEGTYQEEISIASATTIHGGWKVTGAAWSKDCSVDVIAKTVLRSPTVRAVSAASYIGAAGLDTLTIATAAQAASDASAIAILATGVSLKLSGVDLTGGSGGDGSTPAQPAQTGNRTCSGCSTGAAGAPGNAGTPAPAGTFAAGGYVPAVGTAGKVGTQGEHGTVGGNGASSPNCLQGCGSPPGCGAGATGTTAAEQGACGCGGLGGSGGSPGSSGGAAVGVMLVGPGTLRVEYSNVTVGHGGAGAGGGPGGLGGGGTPGTKGSDALCGGSCTYSAVNGTCTLNGGNLYGGSPGGAGGPGGQGGLGGGGAGGPAYGLVAISGAALDVATTVAFSIGAGGTGAGSAPSGASASTHKP